MTSLWLYGAKNLFLSHPDRWQWSVTLHLASVNGDLNISYTLPALYTRTSSTLIEIGTLVAFSWSLNLVASLVTLATKCLATSSRDSDPRYMTGGLWYVVFLQQFYGYVFRCHDKVPVAYRMMYVYPVSACKNY